MDAKTDKIYEILTSTRALDMGRISSLDSTTFIIKGWAVTLVTALIGLALKQHGREFLYIGLARPKRFKERQFHSLTSQRSHSTHRQAIAIPQKLVAAIILDPQTSDRPLASGTL